MLQFAKFVPRNPWLVPPCGHLRTRTVLLVSDNIVFPGGLAPGAVLVKRRHFKTVAKRADVGRDGIAHLMRTTEQLGGRVLVLGSLVVSPGVIDIHTHLNEPGRLEWEGITRGTAAAAAGGITTIVDMPLNNKPSITSIALMKNKLRRVWLKSRVDMAMWGGLVPSNAYDAHELHGMLQLGAVGLKAFMSPSGMDDFAPVTRRDIEAALPVLLAHRKPLMLHAEVISDIDGACDANCSVTQHSSWLATRPELFEVDAARQIVAAMRTVRDADPERWTAAIAANGSTFGVHIAHLASPEALHVYTEAKAAGLPITTEICAHHVTFAAEDVPDGATEFKCAPPLRSAAVRTALIDALEQGDVDLVSSDHSPSTPDLKRRESGDFMAAWGGISSLQYLLPALNTVARDRAWSFSALARLLSEHPARVAGLSDRKGLIKEGFDADIVVWDPYSPANTSLAGCYHRNKLTPYRDVPLLGRVHATLVQGAMVFSDELGAYEARLCGSATLRTSTAQA